MEIASEKRRVSAYEWKSPAKKGASTNMNGNHQRKRCVSKDEPETVSEKMSFIPNEIVQIEDNDIKYTYCNL